MVFKCAEEVAQELGHKRIAIPHLMLGLLRKTESFAAVVLIPNGFHEETVRVQLVSIGAELGTEDMQRDLVQELVDIGRRNEPGGGASWFLTRASERARVIGESLNSLGGISRMLAAHDYVRLQLGAGAARELESAWEGIGDWQG